MKIITGIFVLVPINRGTLWTTIIIGRIPPTPIPARIIMGREPAVFAIIVVVLKTPIMTWIVLIRIVRWWIGGWLRWWQGRSGGGVSYANAPEP